MTSVSRAHDYANESNECIYFSHGTASYRGIIDSTDFINYTYYPNQSRGSLVPARCIQTGYVSLIESQLFLPPFPTQLVIWPKIVGVGHIGSMVLSLLQYSVPIPRAIQPY